MSNVPCSRRMLGAALVLTLALAVPTASAPVKYPPFAARAGLDLARAAARAWAPDAVLVYIENDEQVGPNGDSARWAYLFQSASLGASRGYSVRDGQILVAENLEMQIDVPPIAPDWIDSGAAVALAEQSGGWEFRHRQNGRLSSMLLMRSAFDDKEPDQTTWTLVYTAPNKPALFMVIDAREPKLRRTWRG